MKILFAKTGEATFERIFNRPIGKDCFNLADDSGYRVFQEFLSSEYGKQDKAAVILINFNNAVKDLSSEKPGVALKKVKEIIQQHVRAEVFYPLCSPLSFQVLAGQGIWAPSTLEALDARHDRLAAAAEDEHSRDRNINMKVCSPFCWK